MVSPLQSFIQGQQAGQQASARRFDLEQARAAAPTQSALRDLALAGAQRQFETEGQQIGVGQEIERLRFMKNAADALLQVPIDQRGAAFERFTPLAQQVGMDLSQFTPDQLTDENLSNVSSQSAQFLRNPQGFTSAMRERQANLQALEGGIDPQTGQLKPRDQLTPQQLAAAISLGLEGRQPSLSAEDIEQRERAKLQAQVDVKPELQFAVKSAEEQAKRISAQTAEKRSSRKALEVYEGAFKNLADSLGQTFTGPGVGLIPAITADAQTAQASIAAMAPILKEIFRVAGEGTFTDKDQELLLGMIPDRSVHPEARKAILSNIDSIIRSRLGAATPERSEFDESPAEPAGQQQSFRTQGGEVVTFTVE